MENGDSTQYIYQSTVATPSVNRIDRDIHKMRATSFLTENPESFGITSDAFPIVGERCMVSARGAGDYYARTLMYDAGVHSLEELFDTLYAPCVPDSPDMESILQHNFDPASGGWHEQSLSKYGAVLCQMLLWNRLCGMRDSTGEQSEPDWLTVSQELSDGLDTLCQHVRATGAFSEDVEIRFPVAVGAAYVQSVTDDQFYVTMLNAGAYRFYLLDKNGMAPLWVAGSQPLSEDGLGRLEVRHVHLERSEPFAIVMLSDGACSGFRLDYSDDDSSQMQKGLVWRDRMRLERMFLRVIDSCAQESQFQAMAEQAFANHLTAGQVGASGAMTVVGSTFERFCGLCRSRLGEIEEALEILPDGYDEDHRITPPSLAHTEQEFVDNLLNRSHALQNQMFDIVASHVETMLRPLSMRLEEEYRSLGNDGPLLGSTVEGVFREYDRANLLDRRQIGLNQNKLNGLLAEHWITLRSVFLPDEDAMADTVGNRIYACCLRMNRSLVSMRNKRRTSMAALLQYMKRQCDALSVDCEDHITGRSGSHCFQAGMADLTNGMLAKVDDVCREWSRQSDGYHSMLSAYTSERERLFRLDIEKGTFVAHSDIYNGTLADSSWNELTDRVEAMLSSDYVALLDVIRALSQYNGQLRNAILERDAVGRAGRDMGGRRDCQRDALLAILRGEPGWTWRPDKMSVEHDRMESDPEHDSSVETMPAFTDIINHYHALVRRWHELQKQLGRQDETYAAYRAMYTFFATDRS